jgi:excisionase family DNA binding protein
MKPRSTSLPSGRDLHINAAARILGTDRATIRRLIAEGVLQAYQLTPHTIRVTRESIIELRSRKVPSPTVRGAA